jgi:hypothetical protein
MLPLEAAVAGALRSNVFKKKSRTWWRTTDDVIQVVNLQKSAYGERLYVNLGLYIRSLGSEQNPPEYRCHIRVRLERLVPEPLYSSVASATSDTEPSDGLLEALLVHGVQWLERLASPAGRRTFLREAVSAYCYVSMRAREV